MSSLASQCRLHLLRLELRRLRSGQASNCISHVRSRSQVSGFKLDRRPFKPHQRRSVKVQLMDESFDDFPSLVGDDSDFSTDFHQPSSSDGEESDDDSYVNPYMDVDLPASKKERLQLPDAALAATAHSLRGNQHGRKKRR